MDKLKDIVPYSIIAMASMCYLASRRVHILSYSSSLYDWSDRLLELQKKRRESHKPEIRLKDPPPKKRILRTERQRNMIETLAKRTVKTHHQRVS